MLTGYIEQIAQEFVHGWAADTEQPDATVHVAIYLDGRRIAEIACSNLRRDLRDLGIYGQGLHGFHYIFPTPLPQYGGHRVTVRFVRSGDVLPNGDKVLGDWQPLRGILITAPGRSGTTLLMSRLSLSPQICIAEMHPFEVRQIAYWATVVRTLTGTADFERSMHPDRLEGDGLRVGSNPFSHPDYTELFRTKELEREYYRRFVPDNLRNTARTMIEEYYLRIRCDQQKPEAVLFAEKNNNLDREVRVFARTLFPDLKEIVLIRDPRDLLCSQLSYFRRNATEAMQEITGASRQLLRIKEEENNQVAFVKYESLIMDPDSVSRQLCDYLRIRQSLLINSVKENSAFKVHGTSGSPEASIGRWRTQLSEEEQSWFGTNWHHFLTEFGYG